MKMKYRFLSVNMRTLHFRLIYMGWKWLARIKT